MRQTKSIDLAFVLAHWFIVVENNSLCDLRVPGSAMKYHAAVLLPWARPKAF
jgi:hypothetical protein